jgi:hypothetical protein
MPASLLGRCADPLAKSAVKTGVIVERMQHAESALVECGANQDAVIRWNASRYGPKPPASR